MDCGKIVGFSDDTDRFYKGDGWLTLKLDVERFF